MAALSITVASVATVSGGITYGIAGETITAGMSVYLKASDSRWYMAQCDGTAAEAGSGVSFGFSLHASLAGQPLAVQTDGTITIGATVAIGTNYVIGTGYGSINPSTDLASTNRIAYLGFGSTATVIDMSTKRSLGVSVP